MGAAPLEQVATALIPGRSRGLSWTAPSAVAQATRYLPWLWIVGSPATFALLATGLVGAQRLRKASTTIAEGVAFETCARLHAALGVTRRVAVATCDSVAQPVLVGIVRPLILLPAASLAGWSASELEMVLLHELAHVRRWDNLVNLVQRIVESLLFFHPAVWLVSRQVRRDREDCCDAIVVRHTQRAREYAELLASVAAQRRRAAGPRGRAPRLAGASAMADHPLAGRIRRILNLEEESMRVSRSAVGAIALTLVAMIGLAISSPLGQRQAQAATDEIKEAIDDRGNSETVALQPQDEHQATFRPVDDTKSTPFLSPDDQRAADFVYRALNWEVEPLSKEELRIVTEHGYEGGVRIESMQPPALLVGIHTFPVRDLASLAAILERPAIDQLSPIRYYSLASVQGWGGSGLSKKISRIAIDRLAWQVARDQYGPPRVVGTTPQQALVVVSEKLGWRGLLKATFSQPMQDGSWSWATADEGEFPEIIGSPRFENDGRTCTVSVKLKPGTKYAIWINSPRHKNFKGLDGRPAEPYLWQFETLAAAQTPATYPSPSIQPATTRPLQTQASAVAQPQRLYDGKTLEQWKNLWATELQVGRRLDALRAIGAFARAGVPGAAELALDFATEYPLPPRHKPVR